MLVRRRYWGHNPDLVETYPRRAYLVVCRRYQGITDAPFGTLAAWAEPAGYLGVQMYTQYF
jgi:hypothetical protein